MPVNVSGTVGVSLPPLSPPSSEPEPPFLYGVISNLTLSQCPLDELFAAVIVIVFLPTFKSTPLIVTSVQRRYKYLPFKEKPVPAWVVFLFCGSAAPAALPTKLSVVLILELIETPFNSMFAAVPTFNAVAE